MKITKLILAATVSLVFTVGCKNSDSKPTVNNDTANNSKKEIIAAVKPETTNFKIEGMTCAIGCAKTIEKKLSNTEGVQKATVDFDNKTATVEFDASIVTLEKLTQIVQSTGDGETYKVSNLTTNKKS